MDLWLKDIIIILNVATLLTIKSKFFPDQQSIDDENWVYLLNTNF